MAQDGAQQLSGRVGQSDAAARVAPAMLALAAECDSPGTFLAKSLPLIAQAAGAQYVVLARADRGHWQAVAEHGRQLPPPVEVLAEVLDQGRPVVMASWGAAPLSWPAEGSEILAVHRSSASGAALEKLVDALAALLASALSVVRERQRQLHRARRLEAILEISGQWNQTLEMEPLLVQMAETSTRLLDAERASIFLWDRAGKTLVGRPALGVDGNELRIADDRGVVGQVVQTGETRRVAQGRLGGGEEINRQVDQQLNFTTRTLLCVPLRSKSGQILGAFEMINKRSGDFSEDDEAALTELAAHAATALENSQQHEDLLRRRSRMVDAAAERVQLIGQSPVIEALRSTVRRIGDTDLAILVLGENGTGKEVVSQMIHYLSRRRNEPFIAVNCAALSETLLESELFGHEKGAFTDAHEARAGKFELASGGTLFLDEIGDLSLGGQAKLLRVLEEKVVVRVGGSRPISTDVRVLAATNQDLASMVRQKKFREDLFFRLNVVSIELPPLRERGDDVLLLAEHFLADFSAKARRRVPKFTAAARKRLRSHPWPGNVRELRNLMERLAYLVPGDRVDEGDLTFIAGPGGESEGRMSMNLPLAEATTRFQTDYIQRHIRAAGGNMSEAAQRLGLHRSNLYRKMRQLHMEEPRE